MSSLDQKFKIRVANEDDIGAILQIEKDLTGENPMLEDKVKQMLIDDSSYFLVATFENNVVGYAGGTIRDIEFGETEPIGYVTHVGLNKEFMQKGMGRMLGDQLINKMLPKCNRFRTLLDFNRTDLQSFFNNLGFKRTDILVYQYQED